MKKPNLCNYKCNRCVYKLRKQCKLSLCTPSNLKTPEHIIEELIKALNTKHLKYVPSFGIEPLREAIARSENKKELDITKNNVIVTNGARGALFLTLLTLLKPKEEVIIPNPVWSTFGPIIESAYGIPTPIKYFEDQNLISENIINAISKKTRFIIVNTPENPTGRVIKEKELKEIAKIAKDFNLKIISDEVYDKIIYNNLKHISIFKFAPERTIIINSISKTYSMEGFHLGWLITNDTLINKLNKYSFIRICGPNTIAQYASLAALTSNQECVEEMRKKYEKRKNIVEKNIIDLGWKSNKLEGTYFAFPNIGRDAKKFTSELQKKHQVLISPSSLKDFENNTILCYASHIEQELEEAFRRIKKFLS